jgi:hypothetical protein
MFNWLRNSSNPFPEPLSDHDLRSYGVRPLVFFRTTSEALREMDVPTTDGHVPTGSRILHYICYRYEPPWQVHEITLSLWQGNLTATVGITEDILFHIDLADWEDGWLLGVEPTKLSTQQNIRYFISSTHAIVSSVPLVRDIRWFHNEMLTCGCFHEGDFDRGIMQPFDALRQLHGTT